MVECSASGKARLPLSAECSFSVDQDGGSGKFGCWGGALAVFCFLGLETEAKRVMMEPMGSWAFEVALLLFAVFELTWGAVVWGCLRFLDERRG